MVSLEILRDVHASQQTGVIDDEHLTKNNVEEISPLTDSHGSDENYDFEYENEANDVKFPDVEDGDEENNMEKDFTIVGDANLELNVGMEFESEQASYLFYNDYAKCVGFGIRKRFLRRSKLNNELIGRTYVCSKEDLKQTNTNVNNPRPNTRVGCKAMMQVRRSENGKWVLVRCIEEHNHELNPHSARFFRSQRKISTPEKNIIRTLKSSGVQVCKIVSTIAKQSGGIKNMKSTEKDFRNFIEKERRESLSAGDAQIIYDFFVRTQLSDPRFFYAMELDVEQHLRNVFWVDAKSRMAYAHFGDVVTFDSTYLTNKYSMKFTPFIGVNHHGQSVLLGCALITDETKESFHWVFRTWLTAMHGNPPKAIIIDQDKAIKAAIKEVFSKTRHRLCLWHIMKKVPEKLGSVCKANPKFMYKFHKCIYDSLTIDEFEVRWKNLIEAFELTDHDWLESLYECRTQWIPVYLKNTFFAGMSTSQRSESINSFFDDYVNRKTCLKEFVDQYDLALQKRNNDEEKADFETNQKTPHLKTGSPYEAQMAFIYTLGILKKFQEEVLQIPSCNVVQVQQEVTTATYVIKELVLKPNGKKATKDYAVVWEEFKSTVSCICRMFEFRGYLCRHAMVVLFAVGKYEIPSQYILKHWTKDAKNLDLIDQECYLTQENNSARIAKCFTDLCVDAIKLAEEGSLSTDRYKEAKKILKEALVKLASMDNSLTGCSHEGTQENNLVSNVIVRDPLPSNSKGRPPKRIKSGVEKNSTRGKKYTCSHCKKSGHNIKGCTELQQFLKGVDNESDMHGN